MNTPFVAPVVETATYAVIIGAFIALLALLTVFLVHPVSDFRSSLRDADPRVALGAASTREAVDRSRLRVVAGRLLGHRWTVDEVLVASVCLMAGLGAMVAIWLSAAALELEPPNLDDTLVVLLLGAGLLATTTWCFECRQAAPGFAYPLLGVTVLATVFLSVLRSEATTADPGSSTLFQERLLVVTWLLIDIALIGGCALTGRPGWTGAFRAVGMLLGLLVEIGALLLIGVIRAAEWAARSGIALVRALLTVAFTPAEILYHALRQLAGVDPDGNHRLPPPRGGTRA